METTAKMGNAQAWEKAEQYAGDASAEPEVVYCVVGVQRGKWGQVRRDSLDGAQKMAERWRAEGDEVRICKVTTTRTREWL